MPLPYVSLVKQAHILWRVSEYGERGVAGAQDAAAPTGFDRYGKRRELSDLGRTQASKPYHPSADIGAE